MTEVRGDGARAALVAVAREGHAVHQVLSSLQHSQCFRLLLESNVEALLQSMRNHEGPRLALVESTLNVGAYGLSLCRTLQAAYPSFLFLPQSNGPTP
jgi:hypothetical protein